MEKEPVPQTFSQFCGFFSLMNVEYLLYWVAGISELPPGAGP